jgi:hypothetical protein
MNQDLKQLDYYHVLRNTPLIEVGAKYQLKDGKMWFEVLPSFGIATKTFNQLGESWLHDNWIATKYSEDWQSDERDRAVAQNGNIGYDP